MTLTRTSRKPAGLLVTALVLALVAGIIAWSPGARADNMPTGGSMPGSLGSSTLECQAPDASSSTAGNPTFSLQATDGRIDMPDGNSIYIWGYTSSNSEAQFPGPNLCVNEGDHVTINLTNRTADGLTEDVSMVFPGQKDVQANGQTAQPQFDSNGNLTSLTDAASDGNSVSYTFTAGSPGTYLYESGTDPQKQVQMGLHGALIVHATDPRQAYDDPSTKFANEYLMLLDEIDSKMHQAVEAGRSYDISKYHPNYFTINGRAFPDTLAPNNAPYLPNQPYGGMVTTTARDNDPATPDPAPALIRYVNAGLDNHYIHPHGNHVRLIGHDGRELKSVSGADLSYEKFTQVVASGQTYDGLFGWTNLENWSPTNPVPVQMPSKTNVDFDPEVNMYSGSPYLGKTGSFPTGTTTNNQCGEYYFIVHSHANYEMMNWDAGMGGMTTFFRINPQTGCN